MTKKNQLRIEYNPYSQKSIYQWSSNGKWQNLSPQSKLVTLTTPFAPNFLSVIDDEYNFGNLEIVFCGSDSDFEEFKTIAELHYKKTKDKTVPNISKDKRSEEAHV